MLFFFLVNALEETVPCVLFELSNLEEALRWRVLALSEQERKNALKKAYELIMEKEDDSCLFDTIGEETRCSTQLMERSLSDAKNNEPLYWTIPKLQTDEYVVIINIAFITALYAVVDLYPSEFPSLDTNATYEVAFKSMIKQFNFAFFSS